jgi:hypothetical protein
MLSVFLLKIFDFPMACHFFFQDPATIIMEHIIDLHHDSMFFLFLLIIFVLYMLVLIIYRSSQIFLKERKKSIYCIFMNFFFSLLNLMQNNLLFLIYNTNYVKSTHFVKNDLSLIAGLFAIVIYGIIFPITIFYGGESGVLPPSFENENPISSIECFDRSDSIDLVKNTSKPICKIKDERYSFEKDPDITIPSKVLEILKQLNTNSFGVEDLKCEKQLEKLIKKNTQQHFFGEDSGDDSETE